MTREPFEERLELTDTSRRLITLALEFFAEALEDSQARIAARQLANVMRSEDVKLVLTVRRPVLLSDHEVLAP